MPLYFFNLHDDRDLPDPTGMTLPDLTAARRVAIERIGTILMDADNNDVSSTDWRLDVTDERGLVLAWFHVETGNIPAIEVMWADARGTPDNPSASTAATDGVRGFRQRH